MALALSHAPRHFLHSARVERRAARRAAGHGGFPARSIALLTAAFLLSVAFSQVPSLGEWAFGGFLAVVGFALVISRIVEDETCMAEISIAIAAAAVFLAARVIVWRVDEGLVSAAFHVRSTAWLGKIRFALDRSCSLHSGINRNQEITTSSRWLGSVAYPVAERL